MGPAPEAPSPPPPPPPPGGSDTIYALDVQLSLNKRATQAIAQVTVRDGAGQPVENAEVQGQWSGIITKGDTSRDTDASGVATFYSARSRGSGQVEFCVTNMALAGYTYDEGANVVTCNTVTK